MPRVLQIFLKSQNTIDMVKVPYVSLHNSAPSSFFRNGISHSYAFCIYFFAVYLYVHKQYIGWFSGFKVLLKYVWLYVPFYNWFIFAYSYDPTALFTPISMKAISLSDDHRCLSKWVASKLLAVRELSFTSPLPQSLAWSCWLAAWITGKLLLNANMVPSTVLCEGTQVWFSLSFRSQGVTDWKIVQMTNQARGSRGQQKCTGEAEGYQGRVVKGERRWALGNE